MVLSSIIAKIQTMRQSGVLCVAKSISLLTLRLYIAKVFLTAGLTKIGNWDTTIALFEYEYGVPLLPPEIAAYMATAAELSLPIALIVGLLTPLAALGLFIMTLVIELFIYPGTTEHYYWMLLLGVLITHGGGKLSADFWGMKLLTKSTH